MAELAGYPDDLRAMVENHLRELRFSRRAQTDGLDEAIKYSIHAGGKRVRPVLALATAREFDREPADFLPAACSIEMVHTYSLIHDDLPAMDDDDLRRGQPTSHIRYGEAVAILAGDGMFAEAIGLLASQEGEPARVLSAVRELASATGVDGMVGGQFIDVTQSDLDAEGLEELHSLKTGRLIGASISVVLELIGVEGERARAMREFARELGILFQIVDDILDVVGEADAIGKAPGSDEKHGKLTYVSLFGIEQARSLAGESHERAMQILRSLDADSGDLARIAHYIHERQA